MKLSYYHRRGEQNGRADARHINNVIRRHPYDDEARSTAFRTCRESRLDSLDCEIFSKEFDAYVNGYSRGYNSIAGKAYMWSSPLSGNW